MTASRKPNETKMRPDAMARPMSVPTSPATAGPARGAAGSGRRDGGADAFAVTTLVSFPVRVLCEHELVRASGEKHRGQCLGNDRQIADQRPIVEVVQVESI